MSEQLAFRPVYDTFKMLFCNPDSDDVLEFLYVHDQILAGRDLSELQEEIENNREETGRAYPTGYKQQRKERA